MNPDLLHRGLLLALAELRRQFVADGESFHYAYGMAMRAHVDVVTIRVIENFDPVFGVFHDAEVMLLEGLRDFIISFDAPAHRMARFTISASRAKEELDEMPDTEVYRVMAAKFHEALG